MDFIYGSVSGMFGVLISHPFDTMKTCIQSNKPIYIKNIYKGLIYPLIGTSIEKSIVFGCYATLNKYQHYVPQNKCEPNISQIAINGAITGFISSFIVTPYERLKILAQTGQKITYRGLYTGYAMCMTREIPGFAIYFSNYEYMKNRFYPDSKITKTGSFMIGGMSGMVAWIFIYPQDKIKTMLQSQTYSQNHMQISSIIKTLNFREAYRGFHFALFRAVPLHAGTFMMYEILSSD